MEIIRALITELSPMDAPECTEAQVYSGYFSSVTRAKRALAEAWATRVRLPYTAPTLDGGAHEETGQSGYLYVAELESIMVDQD